MAATRAYSAPAYLIVFLLVSGLGVEHMIRAFGVLVDVIYQSRRQCDFFLHCTDGAGIAAAVLLQCIVFICQDSQVFLCSFIPMQSWGVGWGESRKHKYTQTYTYTSSKYVHSKMHLSVNHINEVFPFIRR